MRYGPVVIAHLSMIGTDNIDPDGGYALEEHLQKLGAKGT